MPDDSGSDHDHEVAIKGGSFSLSELGRLLPGMAEIMPLVGDRIWRCYYAGAARNKRLCRFQLSEAISLMKKGAILRPTYTDDMAKFIDGPCMALRTIIDDEDWDAFDGAFNAMIDEANRLHGVYNKSFLKYKTPEMPPPDMDVDAT